MTAAFVTNLAIVVLPICCLALLAVIAVQLDLGQPEHAGPKLYRNITARHEQDARAADVHAEIQAQRRARHERHEADGEWKFKTVEWDAQFLSWLLATQEPEKPVARSVFGTPEMADVWAEATT